MPKDIVCPACGNRGQATIDGSGGFDVRGQHGAAPVRKCMKCGRGLYLRLFRGPRLITEEMWKQMEEMWEREFGSS